MQFSNGEKGGRPPYDVVLIFKILLLQTLYNLSDEQTEFQIKDRLSFMRFLGLELYESVPDAKTIWTWRERFQRNKGMEALFEAFNHLLESSGYRAMSGQIVDASIIEAPRQRMTKAEKADIKAGKVPESWKNNPSQLCQKDRDARWMVKSTNAPQDSHVADLGVPYFGYKNHISMDKRHRFIRKYAITAANAYDGHLLPEIIDPHNTSSDVWGDKAYRTQENEKFLKDSGYRSQLHRKKPKGKSMPQHWARANSRKSKVRSSVEHVFAGLKTRIQLFIRTIGIQRACIKVGLANLAYNVQRLVYMENHRLHKT